MHASSMENMLLAFEYYVAGDYFQARDRIDVVDIGGANVNGSYADIFAHPKFRLTAVDVAPGPGVDLVLRDPYSLPFADASVDIIISGQAFEHIEFFWRSFAEMIRVLKQDGLLMLIAPSAGPIHQYPVDCYRFYPDAYRALAKFTGTHLVEVWRDERGPWQDLCGVFCKTQRAARPPSASIDWAQYAPRVPGLLPAAVQVERGSAEEELTQGSGPYLDMLQGVHRAVRPRKYLEIGVRHGHSLSLADCPSIGIDPDPHPDTARLLHPIVRTTSDRFFREAPSDLRPDFAFIDGMHLIEYALRDFMQLERRMPPGGVIAVDDVFPNHPRQATRTRQTQVWTGDVWKLATILAEHRPDLVLIPVDTAPTGLLLITALDASNRVLWEHYNPVVRDALAQEIDAQVISRTAARAPDDEGLWRLLQELPALRDTTPQHLRALAQMCLHESDRLPHSAPRPLSGGN